MKRVLMLIASTLLMHSISAKILIITHCFNRPQFIEMHYKTFQKFLLDKDYELVVFNDANSPAMFDAIEEQCKLFNIRCITIPQELHDLPFPASPKGNPKTHPSIRHAVGIKYSLEQLGFAHDDIVFMIDSDMLLLRPFSVREYVKDVDIASVMRTLQGLTFFWPGLVIFKMNELPDRETICFDLDSYGLDTGHYTYMYLVTHPQLRIKSINMIEGDQLFCPRTHHIKTIDMVTFQNPINMQLPDQDQVNKLKEWGFNDKEITFLQKKPFNADFFLDGYFMHYRDYDNVQLCKDFIEDILQ